MVTLTTNELKLIADMLAKHGDVSTRLLEDRIRHGIKAREDVDMQIDTLVHAYAVTALTNIAGSGGNARMWNGGATGRNHAEPSRGRGGHRSRRRATAARRARSS
jgi:hypothetical protein